MSSPSVFGFDLGTCFARVAYWDVERSELPKLLLTIPSVVYVVRNGVYEFGDKALELSANHPEQGVFESKRILESQFGGETEREKQEFDLLKTVWPFRLERTNKGNCGIKLDNLSTVLTPQDVMEELLTYLKKRTEKETGETVEHIVITIPTYFNNFQRVSTQETCKKIGLNVLRMVTDVTAATLYLNIYSKVPAELMKQRQCSSIVLVLYCIGGGSSSVNLVQLHQNGLIETKAASSNKYIGGCDFENEVVKILVAKFKKETGVVLTSKDHPKAIYKLKLESQKILKALDENAAYEVQLKDLCPGKTLSWKFTRETFEKVCAKRFEEVMDPVLDVLDHANMTKDQVDVVVLMGGPSKMVKLKQTVSRYFKGKHLLLDLDANDGIALGAAIQATLLASTLPRKSSKQSLQSPKQLTSSTTSSQQSTPTGGSSWGQLSRLDGASASSFGAGGIIGGSAGSGSAGGGNTDIDRRSNADSTETQLTSSSANNNDIGNNNRQKNYQGSYQNDEKYVDDDNDNGYGELRIRSSSITKEDINRKSLGELEQEQLKAQQKHIGKLDISKTNSADLSKRRSFEINELKSSSKTSSTSYNVKKDNSITKKKKIFFFGSNNDE